jgi:hypothetical protein
MMARENIPPQSRIHECNRSRLAGVEAKSVSREKAESNAVKLALHKILPSGVDGGVHT